MRMFQATQWQSIHIMHDLLVIWWKDGAAHLRVAFTGSHALLLKSLSS